VGTIAQSEFAQERQESFAQQCSSVIVRPAEGDVRQSSTRMILQRFLVVLYFSAVSNGVHEEREGS
jgi:hypothetical protein